MAQPSTRRTRPMAFAHVRDNTNSHSWTSTAGLASPLVGTSDKASYKPYIPSPRSGYENGPLGPFVRRAKLAKYRYEVTFGLYVMTPGEKFILNTVLLLCFSLFALAMLFYLPRTLARLARRLTFYYVGPATRPAIVNTFKEILRSTASHSYTIATSNSTASAPRVDL